MRPAVVALACGVALVAALWQTPADFRALDANAAPYVQHTGVVRSLRAAYGEHIDPRFLLEARRLMPANATFEVLTGGNAPGAAGSALVAIVPYAAYWLLPRKALPAGGPTVPDWVLAYGGDLHSLNYSYRRVAQVAPGLEIAEVAR